MTKAIDTIHLLSFRKFSGTQLKGTPDSAEGHGEVDALFSYPYQTGYFNKGYCLFSC